jgi:hypothetical protein
MVSIARKEKSRMAVKKNEKKVLVPDNHSGRIVAGKVYDQVKKVIIKGATCTLSGYDNKKYVMQTDESGEFWFENPEIGNFILRIEASGFTTRIIDPINTKKDIYLGDIFLYW